MDSIVLELQRKALDKDADVAELVRMALVVARKLRLKDFERWAQLELNGYNKEEVPAYRRVKAEVRAHNPYRGWVPVIFGDSGMGEAAQIALCGNPVAELQFMLTNHKQGDRLQHPFSPDDTRKLMKGFTVPLVPTRLISVSSVAGVLDAVRNIVLEWTLRLEENQILGRGLTFSAAEKKKAAGVSSIHIENFHGVLGNVQAEHIQIGDYNSIRKKLEQLGVPRNARNELKEIFEEFKDAKGKKKQSAARRGLAWAAQHAELLGTFARVIRGWFGAS